MRFGLYDNLITTHSDGETDFILNLFQFITWKRNGNKNTTVSFMNFGKIMGLPLPNRKLFVPRSEENMIVRENPIGFFSP